MAEPHWTAYVGMAAGILGAITGISGAVMGFVSYRLSRNIKVLDLRLELRKLINEIEVCFGRLPRLLDYANQSRQRVSAMTGQAGALQLWNQQFEQDKARFHELTKQAPSSTEEYSGLGPVELESRLVVAHKLQRELTQLTEKYVAALGADDEERKQRREDMRTPIHGAR